MKNKSSKSNRIYLESLWSALILVLLIHLQGCAKKQVDGIKISEDLSSHHTFFERQEFKKLIEKSLQKDRKSFVESIDFNCGGAGDCYDLGIIFTEIIYQIGEGETIQLIQKLTPQQARRLDFLIRAGLEYGDLNNDGEVDNKTIEKEFPKLNDLLINLKRCEECIQ